MGSYKITNMLIDDDFAVEEYVTTEFTHNHKSYSITFKKADLEIINAWVYEEGTSFPADVPEELVESIREEIKKRI
ncbi:hypothetical protein J1P26_14465 [Neobacillus sp. MM2021_6]|uniref:hypothetical protein n=1 Tax=Bacillaceae TaxID=186817 RepID=UPI00140DFD6B|nr:MULTISPECIES: hypothetical protein [Bacillaceae]MBO0960902.1 hypothetical protein [Neobacillus sp. MM2021_6]NHC21479.1 hypothetical protein [Bacillus sp. MM2020_4]